MVRKYKAIIVDDEALIVDGLSVLLREFCPDVEVVGTASSAFEANLKIQSTQPDIVFLDINLPKVNGLEMLQAIEHRQFQVIVITAYDSYALQALKAGAIDYILKPVMSSELRSAVDKAIAIIDSDREFPATERKDTGPATDPELKNRIVIHHNNSYILIEFDDILYLEADRNYSNIVLENGKVISSARSLKTYESLLNKNIFFRVHKSYLVNTLKIKEYLKEGKERIALMKNGKRIAVSQPKQPVFRKFLTMYRK